MEQINFEQLEDNERAYDLLKRAIPSLLVFYHLNIQAANSSVSDHNAILRRALASLVEECCDLTDSDKFLSANEKWWAEDLFIDLKSADKNDKLFDNFIQKVIKSEQKILR